MEKVRKAYYYLFYRIYKLPYALGPISREYSSVLLLTILETVFVISINCFYTIFFDKKGIIELYSAKIIIPLLGILILNHLAFNKNDKWKDYFKEFDKWSKTKSIIFYFLFILIIGIAIYGMQYSLSTMRKISANRQLDNYTN